jgi:hypothetical protein
VSFAGSSHERLRRSAKIFGWATIIGWFALLYCACLVIAAVFVRVPISMWTICFAMNLVVLGAHLSGWLVISHDSMGYGVGGSILYTEYWLVALATAVSAVFTFTSPLRFCRTCYSCILDLAFDTIFPSIASWFRELNPLEGCSTVSSV